MLILGSFQWWYRLEGTDRLCFGQLLQGFECVLQPMPVKGVLQHCLQVEYSKQ